MSEHAYTYMIVGGGVAGASAVDGIREIDDQGSILLLGAEKYLPYHRPLLSKELWFGQEKVEKVFVHDQDFYRQHNVAVATSSQAVKLDPEHRQVVDRAGEGYTYEKLLLATGCSPRLLTLPGGTLPGVCYFRTLEDYLAVKEQSGPGKSATVIGGGFIGSELAAALHFSQTVVTMIFPDPYLCSRIFPEALGEMLQNHYLQRGIKILSPDQPVAFERAGDKFVVRTEKNGSVVSDILIVGAGVQPDTSLAEAAGLKVGNGIEVNTYLQTSHPGVFAAGDNAWFPSAALGQPMRVEHWDNALQQGKCAGRNMAGAAEAYTYQPLFYSHLFEFSYEAVGEIDSRLETFTDWQQEGSVGAIYYLRDNKVRGVMVCGLDGKLDQARSLIWRGEAVRPGSLRGLIK